MTDQTPHRPGSPWSPGDHNDPTLDVSGAGGPPAGGAFTTSGPGGPSGPGAGKPPMGRPIAVVAVLAVVALLIGGAIGFFALGGKKSSTSSSTTTTTKVTSTSTTAKKSTTTSGPPSTTGQSLDPLSVPDGYNPYRAGGAAYAMALPASWKAVLLDSGALDHEAEVHKDNANLVTLLDGVKSLKAQDGIFFAYDSNSAATFEDNVNVIENDSITTLPSNAQDSIRQELSSLKTPAQNIQFANQPVGDSTALVATYEVELAGGSKAYGIQAYFTGSKALYIITMTFGSPDTRQQVSSQAFPTVNVP